MPEPLPPFPTDPGTLDAIEEALSTAVADERAAATRESADAPHGTKLPITEGEVDADPNLDDLLEHLSGYVEEAGVEGEPQSGIVMHSIPTVYNRDDVILALIQEVRSIDKRVQRAILSTAMSRHDAEWRWPQCHKRNCHQDHGDIEFVFSLMAKAIAENVRREMLCRAVTEPDE